MNATVSALQYGLPLYAYARFASQQIAGYGVNFFVTLNELSTPNFTGIVRPNVDTLYSSAVYDLSQNDIRVTVPEVDADRYWDFAFYDPYGNNYAGVGSVNGNTGGEYILRPLPIYQDWGFEPSDELNSTYEGYINSPTINGVVLVRILVKNNGTDLETVQDQIAHCNMTAIPRKRTIGFPLTNATFSSFSSDIPTSTLNLLATLGQQNPPFNVTHKEAEHVQKTLHAAGIRNGTYTKPTGLNLTQAYALAQTTISSASSSILRPVSNNWTLNTPAGIFSSAYLARDIAADLIYLQVTPDQALYPFPTVTDLQLSANESIVYTFSSTPPLAAGGFWSLTLYNDTGYLVANSLNRYSVGDRSNITFADGTLVYGEAGDEDGEFQVLVQPDGTSPPANWTNNWLPAPSDNSIFTITLRLYAPTGALLNDTWEYPIVTSGPAITA